MLTWPEGVRLAIETADAGPTAIDAPVQDPTRAFMEGAAEARRHGYVCVLADAASGPLPADLLHRHVFLFIAGAPVHQVIGWVRELALASPRSHVVVLPRLTLVVDQQQRPREWRARLGRPGPDGGVGGADDPSARLTFAATLTARGALVAAQRELMSLAREIWDWDWFEPVVRSLADVLLLRDQPQAARACLRAALVEARVRGRPVPPGIALRLTANSGIRTRRGDGPMHHEGFSKLLALIEDAVDDLAALEGGCRWLAALSVPSKAGIVSNDGTTLVASEGWRRSDLTGDIAAILAGRARDVRAQDADRTGGRFGVSVRYASTPIGFVVVSGRGEDRATLEQGALALAALGGAALRARIDALALERRAHDALPEIVGDSPPMAAVRDAIVRAAAAPFPVLIEGESGTGKELVARALHRLSPRRDRRLHAVNCAALTDDLLEAELFGHTKGAFTGAIGARAGLFEEANGGTLFLDEVTELSPRAQAKLLRVLQEREIRRLGENAPRPVDVRVVAACNTSLTAASTSGRFRDDLRYRLAVIRVTLPPLRDRPEDVSALAQLFWRRAAAASASRALLGPDALARLVRHPFPGNVRELQNVVAALVVLAPRRGRITARQVDHVLTQSGSTTEAPGVRLEAARRVVERRIVSAALVRNEGRRAAAASELGLTRQGLTKALRRLGLADVGLPLLEDEDAAGVA